MELLTANNVWMMICTALVFFMHLGFTFLEIGLTRQKNTINILFKNFFVITMGLLVYCGFGFNLMYPGDFNIIDGVLGFSDFGFFSNNTPVSPPGPGPISTIIKLLKGSRLFAILYKIFLSNIKFCPSLFFGLISYFSTISFILFFTIFKTINY